jgi:hypothetical protein
MPVPRDVLVPSKKAKSILPLPRITVKSKTAAPSSAYTLLPPVRSGVSPTSSYMSTPGSGIPSTYQRSFSPESSYDLSTWSPMAWFGFDAPLPDSGGGGSDNSGGGGGGGEAAAQIAKFNESYSVEGAPSWWRGFTPDVWNPESEYMTLVNSVLPFLSPEDQRASAQSLARMYPEFAGYGADANPGYLPPPTEMDSGSVNQFLSASRSQQITNALEKMAAASGRKKEEFGPGYSYFKQLASTLGEYGAKGAGEGITRTRYQQLLGQLDPMLAESGGGQLGAYGAIAKMLTNPFFSAGQLGNVIFGSPNAKYF